MVSFTLFESHHNQQQQFLLRQLPRKGKWIIRVAVSFNDKYLELPDVCLSLVVDFFFLLLKTSIVFVVVIVVGFLLDFGLRGFIYTKNI